jgi:C1A family cysteine protease
MLSLIFAQASLADPTSDAFARFVVEFNRTYASKSDYAYRQSVFAENLVKINKQNEEHLLLHGTAVFGITRFADLTTEEFKSRYLTSRPPVVDDKERVVLDVPRAKAVDWRSQGVLTPTKDQGQCGSCWAFSATAAIESFAKIAGKPLTVLAPQQIVSCDKVDGGCQGGWPHNAYDYVKGAGGMETENAYPYTSGRTGQTGNCQFDRSKIAYTLTGYTSVAQGESHLESALNVGPVSVCVDANNWSSYRGGILSSCGRSVDHCVQAVAYTADYWVIRNSWGSGWGEDGGFMRIKRGSDLCLISDYVTYPTFR